MVLVFALPIILKALFLPFYHTETGTIYDDHAIASYVEVNHGPDGKLFLDPYFCSEIESLNGSKILDAGCGAAPWAMYAAKQKGDVYALDIQEKMIQAAQNLIIKENLSDEVKLIQGDVAKLPFTDTFFDKAISICVTSNLTTETFKKHFKEFHRAIKDDGVAIIGAPMSLDVVFTDGSKTEAEVHLRINEILAAMPDNPSPECIMKELNKLSEITSATFYVDGNRLKLVVNKKNVRPGTAIWRKLHHMVIPNRFYTKADYIKTLEATGFDILSFDEPHFASESERLEYNKNSQKDEQLGQNYVLHAPFLTIKAIKKPLSTSFARN